MERTGIVSDSAARRFAALVAASRKVTILTHSHPDGDALGSSGAAAIYLRALGKDALVALPDAYPGTLSFMVDPATVLNAEERPLEVQRRIASSDLLLCLDFNVPSRIRDLENALRESRAVKVLIDHHVGPEESLFDLVISKTDISSASELLYHVLLTQSGVDSDASRLPQGCARALFTGMTTDTNNFSNSVFPSTLNMASDLLAAGVDRDSILDNLYNRYRENRFRAMAYLLAEKLTITPEGAACMVLDRETKSRFALEQGETEGFVNIPLGIAEVRLSIFLTEDEGHFRVSLRSKKGVSARELAASAFHGGGHEQASGGKLYFSEDIPSPEEAEGFVLRVAARFLQESAPANDFEK